MPPRLPDSKRAAILADIRAGQKTRNQIARDHNVSAGTVTNIANQAGDLTTAFDRSQTEKATRAAVIDHRARRAELSTLLLNDVERLRNRAWSPYTTYERGVEGPEKVTLDLPPLRDTREAYTALGIAIDKHLALERYDSTDPGEIASLLGALLGGLQDKHGDGG